MNICRFDKGSFKGKAHTTEEGYIHADAVVTRTGVFTYQNPDGTLRYELRHPDDVLEKASLDSMKMIPITVDHPQEKLVTSENAKRLSVGQTGESIQPDGEHIMASLRITAQDGVDAVKLGKKELSLGYTLDLEREDGVYNGQQYTHRQRNIRYNHLAIVDRARAGGAASLNLDCGDALQVDVDNTKPENNEEHTKMRKVTLDGIEYDAAPEVANALTKADARADKAEQELAEAKTALDTAKAATAKVEAERDELKEKAEANNDADTIRTAVKERLELERVAGKVLNSDEAAKLGEMTDGEIKNAVIMAKNPKANLDGKSEEYLQARFDSVVENLGEDQSADAKQKAQMGERNDGTKTNTDSAEKGKQAFDELKNAWKKETK